MRSLLFVALIVWVSSVRAQNPRIDTVAFHLDNLLLVFKGTVNGVDTDFAFDTGASSSVSNSTNNAASDIRIKTGEKKVTDSNQQKAKIGKVKISDLTVGRYHISDLNAVTFDMPYLKCANMLLLGQDVIKRFNWAIDFDKRVMYVSETPFQVDGSLETWPLKYENKRPVIEYTLNGTVYKSCLIDFGFTGVFDLNAGVKEGVKLYEAKKLANQASTYKTASMGLMGLGTPIQQHDFVIDSIYLSKTLVRHIPVSFDERTDTKLGIRFFSTFCNRVILNFSTNTLHLAPSGKPIVMKIQFDATVAVINGKLTVSGKNVMPGSSAANLEINEEIKSVNGRALADFASECDFMLWWYGYKGGDLLVEKLNGEKVAVEQRIRF